MRYVWAEEYVSPVDGKIQMSGVLSWVPSDAGVSRSFAKKLMNICDE